MDAELKSDWIAKLGRLPESVYLRILAGTLEVSSSSLNLVVGPPKDAFSLPNIRA